MRVFCLKRNSGKYIISVSGVVQTKSTYQIIGNTINFIIAAPAVGAIVEVTTFGPAMTPTGTVVAAGFKGYVSANNAGTAFAATLHTEFTDQIFMGLVQYAALENGNSGSASFGAGPGNYYLSAKWMG